MKVLQFANMVIGIIISQVRLPSISYFTLGTFESKHGGISCARLNSQQVYRIYSAGIDMWIEQMDLGTNFAATATVTNPPIKGLARWMIRSPDNQRRFEGQKQKWRNLEKNETNFKVMQKTNKHGKQLYSQGQNVNVPATFYESTTCTFT